MKIRSVLFVSGAIGAVLASAVIAIAKAVIDRTQGA
jgi:hypothetical protein